MKKFLSLIFVLITGSAALCQDKTLLSDNFNNNKNGWRLQNDSIFLVDIDNGVLHLEKFRKARDYHGCLWYRREIKGLNTLQDFSITIFAKYLSGGDNIEMLDIQWGIWGNVIASKATSIYQLNFILKGDVKLDYFNKTWNYSLRYKAKEILDRNLYRPGEYNKYEVVQKDGFIIFKVNDKQYFKQFAEPISGNTIGFQGCLKSAWEIDKIIIRQLNVKTGNKADSISQITVIDSIDQSGKNNEGTLKVVPNPFVNEFTVTVVAEKFSNSKIELFDINGNLIMQHDRKLQAGEHNLRMYAEVIPGTYILKLTIDGKVTTTKLVKL